jgi:hypothetical protein
VRADAPLYLVGTADDELGRALRGRRLTWFVGRRRAGSGNAASVLGLHPGNVTIRLVARDSRGRHGVRSVRVRVLAVTPRLLAAGAPRRISPRARSVTLRILASVPSRLTIGRRHFAVGRRARRVRVAVRPGAGALQLTLRLSAGRRASVARIVIPRA